MFENLDYQNKSVHAEFLSYPPNSNENPSWSKLEVQGSVMILGLTTQFGAMHFWAHTFTC